MSISKVLFFSIIVLSFTTSCSKDLFITHNGNMPTNERISRVKVGQSKAEVKSILGSPSNIVSLDKNTWIYMSSDIEQIAFLSPKEVNRDVLTIKFNESENIMSINRMSKKDGVKLAISEEKTETVGHEPGFFEKFFGGIGSYSPFGGIQNNSL